MLNTLRRLLLASFFLLSTLAQAQVIDSIGHRKDSIQNTKSLTFQTTSIVRRFYQLGINHLDLELQPIQSLVQIVENQSSIQIRTNGPSGLASPNIRGTSGGQSVVQRDGFSINSPMNGVADLNLLPTFFLNKVSINRSPTQASSEIGGKINLISVPSQADSGSQWLIHSAVGSFGNRQLGIGYSYGNKKNYFSAKLYADSISNQYSIPNSNERLINGDIRRIGGNVIYKFGSKWNVSALALATERGIANSSVSRPGTARQKDSILRISATYSGKYKEIFIQNQFGLNAESNVFIDSAIGIYSPNRCLWAQDNVSANGRVGKIRYNIEGGLGYLLASTPYFKDPISGFRGKLTGKATYFTRKNIQINATLGKEWFLGKQSPITGGIALTQSREHWNFFILAMRNFRFPTLNDWYWNPGGDSNLKPEKSINSSVGLRYFNKIIQLEVLGFWMNVTDQIVWLPSTSGIWYATNQSKFRSYGLEIQAEALQLKLSPKWKADVSFNGVVQNPLLIGSTNQSPLYVSKVKFSGQFSAYCHQLSMALGAKFTGARPTDFSGGSLAAYTNVFFRAAYPIRLKHASLNFFAQADNIFNTRYESVPYLWMPGRSFQVGIQVKFIQ